LSFLVSVLPQPHLNLRWQPPWTDSTWRSRSFWLADCSEQPSSRQVNRPVVDAVPWEALPGALPGALLRGPGLRLAMVLGDSRSGTVSGVVDAFPVVLEEGWFQAPSWSGDDEEEESVLDGVEVPSVPSKGPSTGGGRCCSRGESGTGEAEKAVFAGGSGAG